MDKLDLDQKKERGWIMRILDRAYPDGIDQDTIKNQLIDLRFVTSDIDMRSNVAYLEDKGLIKVHQVGPKGLQRTVLTLHANGKDLIDGVIESVPGVDL